MDMYCVYTSLLTVGRIKSEQIGVNFLSWRDPFKHGSSRSGLPAYQGTASLRNMTLKLCFLFRNMFYFLLVYISDLRLSSVASANVLA